MECCALARTDCRPLPLRQRASRPQLKHNPLGCSMSLNNVERQRARAEAQAAIDAASLVLERGTLDDTTWTRAVADALASAYLRDDDPRWQSGFDGDSQLWRDARELILAPVHRDGTFLDIGCATGYLMGCLQPWPVERGRRLSRL